MKIGDKVMYSRAFCRSVGLYASNDPLVHRSKGGKIIALRGEGRGTMATITDADGEERKALVVNLALTTALEA